jgi:hypothetical protein
MAEKTHRAFYPVLLNTGIEQAPDPQFQRMV